MRNTIVILNEREWCERALNTLDMGKNPSDTLKRLARYYRARGCRRKDIVRHLEEFVIRCNPHDPLSQWDEIIQKSARRAGRRPLIEVEGVSITKGELRTILSVDGLLKQRLLFTMLCLAKFGNAINDQNNNWVNKPIKDIFTLANIKLACERRLTTIHDLHMQGLIQLSKSLENSNMRLPWIEKDGEEIIFISDFRNIGNQFMRFIGEDYIECDACGLVVKRYSNRQVYCSECAAMEHRAQMIEKYYAQTSEDPYSLLALEASMRRIKIDN